MTDDAAHEAPVDADVGSGDSSDDPLGPLAAFVGTWRGAGHGHYPTITDFDYTEEVTFVRTGKPLLGYRQRTWGSDGRPLHAESGWLRWVGGDRVEWVVAQPTGIAETATGTVRDGEVDVQGVPHLTPTAVSVSQVRRRYRVDGAAVDYDLWMTATTVPNLTHHLNAVLERQNDQSDS
jgi:hypothetical protein